MPLRDNELARRQEGKIELRPQPLRLRWSFNKLLTSDGHELRAVFTCSARALPDPIERRMFEEVLLGTRYSVTDEELAAHFQPALESAATKAAEQHTAAEWGDAPNRDQMLQTLRNASAPVAFGCGIELLPPFEVDLQSPSYQRQRVRAMQQGLAEKQAAGQMEHVQRAAELLKQFQSLRQAAPDLSPGRVLGQISPADRGAVLQTLLLASAKERRAEQLWAVAGPYLARIETEEGSPRPQLFPLPPNLGPLRSISAADIEGRRRLLIGARSGFMLVDPENPAEPQLFSDSGIESALGFNRVIYWGMSQGFAASHGDAGIVRWTTAQRESPATALRPDRFSSVQPTSPPPLPSASGSTASPGPRNLQVLDERSLIFSAGNRLFSTDLEQAQPIASESNSEVVAIVPDDEQLVVVHQDGTLCGLDRQTRKLHCLMRRGTRVRSLGLLPWMGGARLLLAGDDGPINCIGFDDPLVTEYQSPHRGFRVVAGSTDWVAGISADRQRVILWQTWDGRQPLSEVYLTGLTRHRIADLAFA